jgi:hypothetical protein
MFKPQVSDLLFSLLSNLLLGHVSEYFGVVLIKVTELLTFDITVLLCKHPP